MVLYGTVALGLVVAGAMQAVWCSAGHLLSCLVGAPYILPSIRTVWNVLALLQGAQLVGNLYLGLAVLQSSPLRARLGRLLTVYGLTVSVGCAWVRNQLLRGGIGEIDIVLTVFCVAGYLLLRHRLGRAVRDSRIEEE